MSIIGHNSGEARDDQLRLLIERIENLETEKRGVAEDIRDAYSEAKSVGYDTTIMRQVVKLRKLDGEKRREAEMVLETYLVALGMI